MEIKLKQESYDKALEFAGACVDTNLDEYKRRRQFNRDKIIADIAQGKLAEMAVCVWLWKNGVHYTEPDFEIYSKKKKSFDSDLKGKLNDSLYEIHVKSQSKVSASRYGLSWCFQKKDVLTTNPKPNDIMVLCVVDGLKVEVSGSFNAIDLVLLYEPPQIEYLGKTKHVLYWETIKGLRRFSFPNEQEEKRVA